MSGLSQFELLAAELKSDPDADVTQHGDSHFVRAHRFAFLRQNSLAVELPSIRAEDLISRKVAHPLTIDASPGTRWITVEDQDDWSELAAEAHPSARGTAPGGHS